MALKVSDIIAGALENNYCNGNEWRSGKDQFMCHAVRNYARSICLNVDHPIMKFVKHEIKKSMDDEFTLDSYLRSTNKKYRAWGRRYGSDTPACYKLRVKHWEDLIEKLRSEGK